MHNMKQEKGITLMALTIYVIIFVLLIGIISTLTSFFYNNVINFDESTKGYAEINKFNMYLLQDIKKDGSVIENLVKNNDKNIGITIYNSKDYETNVYKFDEDKKAIYRNGTLICKDISNTEFRLNDNNKILTIYIETAGENHLAKTMAYAINN